MPVYTPKKIYTGQPGTTSAAIYQVPAGINQTIIKNIIVCNTTANIASITMNLVAYGGSPTAANRIMSTLNINAFDTVVLDLSCVLISPESIYAQQGTNAALTVHISGLEVV